jgi:hypothetical protein
MKLCNPAKAYLAISILFIIIIIYLVLNPKTLEKFEINLNYKIFKTIKNKCIRCLLFKCEAQEVVCEECTKNMKLLI